MIRFINPANIVAPASRYSHAAEVGANARWLHISGQIGVNPDGTVAPGIEAQTERAWLNIIAILEAAEMGLEDLVKINALLVDREHLATVRAVRDRHLGDHQAASTLYIVAGLAKPEWQIEVEAVAAKA